MYFSNYYPNEIAAYRYPHPYFHHPLSGNAYYNLDHYVQPNLYPPLQPPIHHTIANSYPNSYFQPNPYPQFNPNHKENQPILSQFKSQDGKFDINKMIDTAGQMVGAVNQLSSIFKGISQTFKGV